MTRLEGAAEATQTLPLRVAVLGAGAVAELCHLPALAATPEAVVSTIVDLDVERARSLAERFPRCRVASDFRDALDHADAVINALPHDLHAPISIECLYRGIGVLVEKPMARNAAEARAMIEAAERSGAVLQVGLMYRFCDGPRLLKQSIDSGRLGAIRGFRMEWGSVYDWPVRSGFFFDRARAGGGVLIDTGSHALDLLSWLLGRLDVLDYADDARGGVEAECEITLTSRSLTGVPAGSVTLSRLRPLANTLIIDAEHWTVTYDLNSPDSLEWRVTSPESSTLSLLSPSAEHTGQSWNDAYRRQLCSFIRAVSTREPAGVAAANGVVAVELIDACYAMRRTLVHPWESSMEGRA